VLSSPVLDSVSGRIMVGSQNGQLYSVNSSTGAVVGTSSSLGGPNGVYDAPLVDSTAAMVYAFAGAVNQFPVTFSSGSGTAASVGVGDLPMFSGGLWCKRQPMSTMMEGCHDSYLSRSCSKVGILTKRSLFCVSGGI
jgi:hypothetical protein